MYNIGVFTGIISATATVCHSAPRGHGLRLTARGIPSDWDMVLGESIALAGVCLTVVDFRPGEADFDIGAETLSITGAGSWSVGSELNLERALRVGDALGGHLVSGHVDGTGTVQSIALDTSTLDRTIWIALPSHIQRYVSHKGSITLDGISLTVNEVHGELLRVNLIPHTVAITTARLWHVGRTVHVEVDRTVRSIVDTIETYFAHNKAQ